MMELLTDLGAEKIKASIFNSQVGEYAFYQDGSHYDAYEETNWQWLPDPCAEEDELDDE